MATLQNITQEVSTKAKIVTLPPKAIGHNITTKVPTLSTKQKILDARELIFQKVKDFDTINYIYILTKSGKLAGVISIKDIFRNSADTRTSSIMQTKVYKAHLTSARERVAHQAIEAGIKAVPLVDEKNQFLGVVPSDQIQSILYHESKDDLLKLSGIIGKIEDTAKQPIISAVKGRTPWILIGLMGSLITASAITKYQVILEKHLILASFIPLIAYVANATATQTQTLYVRDLAIQTEVSFKKYLSRQLKTTLVIALTCWAIMLLVTTLFWGTAYVGFIVGLSLTIAILTATFLATLIPQLLKKYGFDPAVGGGPFATVIQDFLSITIYFTIASLLL